VNHSDRNPFPIRSPVPGGQGTPAPDNHRSGAPGGRDRGSDGAAAPGPHPSPRAETAAAGAADGTPAPGRTAVWRVPPSLAGLKAAGATLFLFVAVILSGDSAQLLVAAAAALVLGAMALRDLIAPIRLAADPEGITVVTGFATRRRLAWSQVERIRVDVHRRFGLRSELVEIDIGETLFLFSSYELGAPCDEVVDTLRAIRTGRD